jgi:hypothetical protein
LIRPHSLQPLTPRRKMKGPSQRKRKKRKKRRHNLLQMS